MRKPMSTKGALDPLSEIVLKDTVVVGDAAFCQCDPCERVRAAEGDYMLAVKGNQPTLFWEISLEFQATDAAFSHLGRGVSGTANGSRREPAGKGHGWIEIRTMTSSVALNSHVDWLGVRQVLRVVCERRRSGLGGSETQHFVATLPREKADASRLLSMVRRHCEAIENGLHWVRDMLFREGLVNLKLRQRALNLVALRNASLTCLRTDTTGNRSATLCSHYRKPHLLLAKLGIL